MTLTLQSFEREARSMDRLFTRCTQQLAKADPSTDAGRAELAALLSTAREQFKFHKTELEQFFNDDKRPEQVSEKLVEEQYDTLCTKMFDIIGRCNVLLSGVPPRPVIANPLAHSTRVDAATDGQNTTLSCSHIKVPKFNLPHFEGDFTQWENFWARFDTLIHQSTTLSKVEKFEYLMGYLKGSALSVVNHLDFKENNYDAAVTLLKERYSNPRRTIAWHSNGLLNLPSILPSVTSIRGFLDKYNIHFYSLKNHPSNLNVHEVVFSSFILSRFSHELRVKFETQLDTNTVDFKYPSPKQIVGFLDSYVTRLENTSIETTPSNDITSSGSFKPRGSKNESKKPLSRQSFSKNMASLATSLNNCAVCDLTGHSITSCSALLGKTPKERYLVVKSKHLCVSCLLPKHRGRCSSRQPCQHCNSAGHHSLLHFGKSSNEEHLEEGQTSTDSHKTAAASTSLAVDQGPADLNLMNVLMATCLVKLKVSPSKYTVVRAILDTASHVSFISEHCAQMLQCARVASRNQIKGVGSVVTSSNGLAHLDVDSLSDQSLAVKHPFVILNKITGFTPRMEVSAAVKDKVKNLVLADPTFSTPAPIDCLLGADLTAKSLKGHSIPLGTDLPVAVDTHFGYVLMGSSPAFKNALLSSLPDQDACLSSLAASTDDDLLRAVQDFWSIEEPPQCTKATPDDAVCEKYFEDTTTRLPCGRYQVRLPFKKNTQDTLGSSRVAALSRLKALEHRFQRDPQFKDLYVGFMEDYKLQGHMSIFSANYGPPKYLLCHHGIFKRFDTKKIRVVFDGSVKTTSGVSLNDILYSGPKLQPLISDVITLFRFFLYAFICDIEQMFRQIRIHPEDVAFQCLLWRNWDEDGHPIEVMGLDTVTYGTASAPYLALRTLRQLAQDEGNNYPLAAKLLLRDSFVDDINGGGKTLSESLEIRNELIAMLKSAGFKLKKWASNNPALLADLPDCDLLPSADNLPVQFLGLEWYTSSDDFRYPVDDWISEIQEPITKRTVLAQTARLYDPCGWMSPVVLQAKHFLQTLWQLELSWDTPLPSKLCEDWLRFVSSLRDLKDLSISRSVSVWSPSIQLHGFCDASSIGYAAVIYLRASSENIITCRLLASKTRVAPLKPVTIPRLELMGAHLLAKLYHHHMNLLKSDFLIEQTFLWTDSTIVLDWIKTPPHLLQMFVANRVSQISDWTFPSLWNHINGSINPADIASRGASPQMLATTALWWEGPPFLSHPMSCWPSTNFTASHSTEDLELKPCVSLASAGETPTIYSTFSSWSRVIKVMSLIVKWVSRVKRKLQPSISAQDATGYHQLALQWTLRYIQQTSSIHQDWLKVSRGLPASKPVQRGCPFIDPDSGLLRARGRVVNAYSYSGKFPVILPKDHFLIPLLVRHCHIWLGHAGPTQVQYQLSLNYWILSARQVIRRVINQCVICFRAQPKSSSPLMGDLPECRVNPAPPFHHTGMDFCGPFTVKASRLRKAPLMKAYGCLFICMSTKAVHLEVALDLSALEFLDCLRRFCSRRGSPHTLYSDCGLNFIGSRTLLQKEFKALISDPSNSELITNFVQEHNIHFVFSCPSAPHQNGLWERAIRSMKFHLKRVVGLHILTVPQLTSLAIQIEGILNSRPLTPLSCDSTNLDILTPGHFLIGRPVTAPPGTDLSSCNDGTLRHFQLLTALVQRFWKQWRTEYLSTLQARSKWTRSTPNLQVGDVVIVDEPNCQPLQWPLGLIIKTYPNKSDGIVRRATVKTTSGVYDRPAVKLFRLPVQSHHN